MNNDDEFKKEIIKMVKEDHRKKTHGAMSAEGMRRVDEKVYAHINQMFNEEDAGGEIPTAAVAVDKVDIFTRISRAIKALFTFQRFGQGFAAVALASVGVFTFNLLGQEEQMVPDVPESLRVAGLEQYVTPMRHEIKSIARETPSKRRVGFLTGATQAALDMISDESDELYESVLNDHREYVDGENTAASSSTDREWFSDNLDSLKSGEDSRIGLVNGYAVEILTLAASRSLDGMVISVLHSAIGYYREVAGESGVESADPPFPEQYLENHLYFMSVESDSLDTPSDVQRVIDKTVQMKVLVD